ncbi:MULTISPECIES: hypothetical protein [unclassified Streptomyces]|uniref:effector-associated constant component EACC1 n=1 Tax=unclassified Streptomyces TaxID=2593676 RepID=UPI000AB31C46|nr:MULTISPECIES: hypothetical protein [unclassified Streptomyces]
MRISMTGSHAEEELRSLRAWLLESPEIRQRAQISWETSPPKPGEMGGTTFEVLQLVTDNLWQTGTFALAYATWRKTRTRNHSVTIEYNGRQVTIEGDDSAAVERIAQAFDQE